MPHARDVPLANVFLAVVWFLLPQASLAQGSEDSLFAGKRSSFLFADQASGRPYTMLRAHDAGNLHLSVTNWGVFGNPQQHVDPKTGLPAPRAVFPAGSNADHLLWGELWVGALVEKRRGLDTLVSTGYAVPEFFPDSYENGGEIAERSDDPRNLAYDPEATSAQDFLCVYTDTLTDPAYVEPDPADHKPHRPLPIRVRQGSYVWPFAYGRDLVIIQYWITNLGDKPLREVRVGVAVHPTVWNLFNSRALGNDELVGFVPSAPSIAGFGFADSVMTAWWADNDGDPGQGKAWNEFSVRSAMGLRILGVGQSRCAGPSDPLNYSFNWWAPHTLFTLDWGPQRLPGDKSIIGGNGNPLGDAQKYRYMANGEIDPDQHLANKDRPGWITSPGVRELGEKNIYNLADGHTVTLLLSVGPFALVPGDSIPIGIVVAAEDFFHLDPDNGRNLSKNPEAWYSNVDLRDLAAKVQWAEWIYDNPGTDTDGDGCAGAAFETNCRDTFVCYDTFCWQFPDTFMCWYDVCWWEPLCDSIWYAGDGVPDLKGPPPPPSPRLTIQAEPGQVRLSWDGRESELYLDPFQHRCDFEGYNVYGGRGQNLAELGLMASWDLIDFDRYHYVPQARLSSWVLSEPPFTIEQLHQRYGADFDPTLHADQSTHLEDAAGDRCFFRPHGGNRGNEYVEAGEITANPIQYVGTDSLWSEGRRAWQYFGRYECTVDNLLASQPYYFAVTAFDVGVAAGNLGPLESSTKANLQLVYPTYSPDYLQQHRLQIAVYPNPYKIDAGYRRMGYEDPNREGFLERTRRIHFANLPPQATIRIYSLDGDLIRELHHPDVYLSDTPSHCAWDLITRNTQAVVSGIYLYAVESAWGTQVGKIVIIK